MAFVFGVIAAMAAFGSRLNVFSSMSAKTARAPSRATAPAVAKNVNGEVTTSSPAFTSRAWSASTIASLPFATPTVEGVPMYAAADFSNAATRGPRMKVCESSTSRTAVSTSALMGAYCAFRSRRGTLMFAIKAGEPSTLDYHRLLMKRDGG
jgi:hypothetical protein